MPSDISLLVMAGYIVAVWIIGLMVTGPDPGVDVCVAAFIGGFIISGYCRYRDEVEGLL